MSWCPMNKQLIVFKSVNHVFYFIMLILTSLQSINRR